MDALTYYLIAEQTGLTPALLEFQSEEGRLTACGIRPSMILEVRDGRLFKDGIEAGNALSIFDHLSLPPSPSFFPAFIGFFSYEFAQYFKKVTQGSGSFPDAYFCLYKEGLVVKDGVVVHCDQLPNVKVKHKDRPSMRELAGGIKKQDFIAVVADIKERICRGDVYQVNFSLPFSFEADKEDLCAIYQAFAKDSHSPFMGLCGHGDWQMLSLSPERLFSLKNGELCARPIAGTKRRDADPKVDDAELLALKNCPKENAEHAMLVDLMRNDLNQVATPGTLRVVEDRTVEFYSHVMHLVSKLSCKTRASLKEIFCALFPGGTITGAPKLSVMQAISELEQIPRGPYTGSFGYISAGFGADFNILIRSIFRHEKEAYIRAGAGIVIDSIADNEWDEIHKKAQGVRDILANELKAKPLRSPIFGRSLPTHAPDRSLRDVSLWFLENEDSFSFNIIDALKSLGALVRVARPGEDLDITCSHVLIGPGPGNPELMPELALLIEKAIAHKKPLLGICLGHQAIGHYFKAQIVRLRGPVHGQAHLIHHQSQGLFSGLSSPALFARYHSLAVRAAPRDFLVDAHSPDDHIMALRHQVLPIFGLQFHPESYLSKDGLKLLENFLRVSSK